MNFVGKFKQSNGTATNSIMLTFVQVITTILGLIVTKLLSAHFSLQEYGTYSQALLVTTTVTSISILGLTNATNYFYNRTKKETEQKQYLSTIFTIQYVVGTVSALAMIVFRSPIASYFNNKGLTGILTIVSFMPILQNLISMYQVLFVSIGRAKVIAIRNLIVSIIRLLAVVVACFVFNNIITVLVVVLCLDVLQVVYFFSLFRKYKYPIRIRDTRINLIREILTFGIPMSIYILTNSLSRDIDKYVISAVADTETLAIYSNAAKVLPFDMITSSLITVLIPIITRMINGKKYGEAKEIFKLYLRMGCVLTFIFVGGAIAVSKNLMLFLYDEKYLAGLPVFVVYLVVDMVRFANVTTILSGAGKTKILMSISVITMGLNASLNVVGYKLFGLVGPALVTLLLTLGMTMVLLHYGAREIHTRIVDLFDFKEIGIISVQIVAMGFFTYFFSAYLNQKQISYVISLIICYGTYVLVLGFMNYKRAIECYHKLNCYK